MSHIDEEIKKAEQRRESAILALIRAREDVNRAIIERNRATADVEKLLKAKEGRG